MGIIDLMAWVNASDASNKATTANEKIDALEKKIDLIAQELHNLQVTMEASNARKKTE
jgi:hypothetical protein